MQATAPIARAVAGRRGVPLWALIRHRGRRTGTPYETPIAIVPTKDPDVVMIGLPWGASTNWARNVIAEASTTVRWNGRDVALSHPRIVDARVASGLARAPFNVVIARFPAAIVLDKNETAQPSERSA